MRRLVAVLLVFLVLPLGASPRRRAVAAPAATPIDVTPQAWLAANSHVLDTIQFGAGTGDLFPLRAMIGSAQVVALGDITHGTHEFYLVKHRIVDYLVREMEFDVLALEAPFPLVERLNTYIQTGAGDPRSLLAELYALTYFFWDAEEILDIIEWMRESNSHRGERPALYAVGIDVTQPDAASNAVVAYLRTIDPVAAVGVEQQYACARESSLTISNACRIIATNIFHGLVSRQSELIGLSSAGAYREALHHARVVMQSRFASGPTRDQSLAENVLVLREQRGITGRMILWTHSAHISETENESVGNRPMGRYLADALQGDYFTLTTMTAAGTFRQWEDPNRTRTFTTIVQTFPPLAPESYESYLRLRGQPYLLLNFRKVLPPWLTTRTSFNLAGSTGPQGAMGILPAQYDAAIFIDTTTPLYPLIH